MQIQKKLKSYKKLLVKPEKLLPENWLKVHHDIFF